MFLQSGIEKILDRKEKLGRLMVRYKHSSFVKMAPSVLTFFTIIELVVGGMAILSQFAVALQIYRLRFMPINTALSACFVLLGLYISQRKGQDLDGAGRTGRYLFFAVLGLIVIWGGFFNYAALYPFI